MQVKHAARSQSQSQLDYSGTWARVCLYSIALLHFAVLIYDYTTENFQADPSVKFSALILILSSLVIFVEHYFQILSQLFHHKPNDRLTNSQYQLDESIQHPGGTKGPENHLEILGRLAGGVAHDFNNSLMVLANCIEAMRTTKDSIARQSLLFDMDSALKGAQSTALQLMSLSNEGTISGQPSDPRSALRSIASNLRRIFPENITIKDELRGTPAVSLISGQFEQVILNLCLNSKDKMPHGGEITLRCYKDLVSNQVIVEIEDSSTADFYSMSFSSIEDAWVYHDITKLGGDISFKTVDYKGSCIILKLPIAEKKETTDIEKPKSEQLVIEGENQKILLLDDDELVLMMMSARFKKAGYKTSVSTTIAGAMKLLSEKSFDILVSDAVLPDGTPMDVIEKFRMQSSGPTIICSGYSKNDPLLAELKTENSIFFHKPFSIDELIKQLNGLGKTP